jgi:hypothetical protein
MKLHKGMIEFSFSVSSNIELGRQIACKSNGYNNNNAKE